MGIARDADQHGQSPWSDLLGAKLQYVQAFQARETTWVAYVLCQPAHSAWLYDGTAATKSLTLDRVSISYPHMLSSTWERSLSAFSRSSVRCGSEFALCGIPGLPKSPSYLTTSPPPQRCDSHIGDKTPLACVRELNLTHGWATRTIWS